MGTELFWKQCVRDVSVTSSEERNIGGEACVTHYPPTKRGLPRFDEVFHILPHAVRELSPHPHAEILCTLAYRQPTGAGKAG